MGRVNFSCTCEWQPGKRHVWAAAPQKDGWRARYSRGRSWLSTPALSSQRKTNRSNICARRQRYAGGRREMDRQMPRERQDGARSLSCPSRQPHHFRSRHALGLSYCSNWRKKRHGERAKRLMDRLGATWREPPIRPKNMQRRTFKRLVDELWDAWLSDAHANLGVWLDRDALAKLGSAELDDIARKRVTDIALRRRRRKSSN